MPFCWPAWRQGRPVRGPGLRLGRGVVGLGWTDISHLKVRHLAYAGHLELVWVVRDGALRPMQKGRCSKQEV